MTPDVRSLIGSGPGFDAIRKAISQVAPNCVVVCPMECFHGDDRQLYIDPDDCIDCGACIPECPVGAIFQDADVPAQWTGYVQLNADRVRALKPAGAQVTEKRQR